MSAPWAGRLSTITLVVEDLAVARRFYTGLLDVPVIVEDPQSVVVLVGGLQVNLLQASAAVELLAPAEVGAAGAAPRFVLTVDVADVDAVCATLVGRGVLLLNGPVDRPWGVRTASFADPDGYVWELARVIREEPSNTSQ